MTSYASVLTITAFTYERYIAICHPMKFQSRSSLQRTIKVILLLWIIACCCALPYPIHTRENYILKNPHTGENIDLSLMCSSPDTWRELMTYFLQISTFVFFVFPMTMITIMYILIGVTLRNSEVLIDQKGDYNHTAATTKARKAVLKMLGKFEN